MPYIPNIPYGCVPETYSKLPFKTIHCVPMHSNAFLCVPPWVLANTSILVYVPMRSDTTLPQSLKIVDFLCAFPCVPERELLKFITNFTRSYAFLYVLTQPSRKMLPEASSRHGLMWPRCPQEASPWCSYAFRYTFLCVPRAGPLSGFGVGWGLCRSIYAFLCVPS